MGRVGTDNQPIGSPADIEWDEQGYPHSRQFSDIYFMQEQGLAESRYVFLQQNQLSQRFSALDAYQSFTVGETGFGSGLNFLACWQLWQQCAADNAKLNYVAVEKYPLKPEDLKRCIALQPELKTLGDLLQDRYQSSFSGCASPGFRCFDFGRVRLLLIIDEAQLGLQQLLAAKHPQFSQPQWHKVDAWFLDGFAPAKNPKMWTEELFTVIASLSKTGATLATFTAAGFVNRQLDSKGFAVTKVKGFGNKREMLTGTFQDELTSTLNFTNNATPWNVINHFQPAAIGQSIAVIGGGIAGCHTAYALAKRGYKVTLIERHHRTAQEASGNPQGIVYAKLSAHPGDLGEFNLSALLFAQSHYQSYWQSCASGGAACGILQLGQDEKTQHYQRAVAQRFPEAGFVTLLSAARASDIAGIDLNTPALYFPHCGWLVPPLLCEWLLGDPNIELINHTHIQSLELNSEGWQLSGHRLNQNKQVPWNRHFDRVVIATANETKQFEQTQWLPTNSIRGQITYLPQQAVLPLKTVICDEAYIAPSLDSAELGPIHTLGASYNLHDSGPELSAADHQQNIDQISQVLPQLAKTKATSGRVGFRCTSPDYLPLAGPVPQCLQFQQDYQGLTKNARKAIAKAGSYWPGLYVNVAHGSRGLVYSPLAAEIIASTIAGEVPPVGQNLVTSLNPARFLIRKLSKGG